MAHIRRRKLKRGTAHEVYYCSGGVPHSKYFPPEIPFQIVKDFAAKIEHDKAFARAGVELPKAALSLSALVRAYVTGRASEIDPWREVHALNLLLKFAGNIPAERVTPEIIHRFRDDLLATRKSGDVQRLRRGVNKDLRNLRTVFNWAHKNGLLSGRPFDRVTLLRADPVIPEILSRDEMMRFYHALPRSGYYRMFFTFMRYTGRRRSEILRLKYEDIDLQAGTIRLPRRKTGGEKTVAMHARLFRILWFIDFSGDSGQLVFPVHKDTISHAFAEAMRQAGIRKKMPTHILRHTYVARIIERYLTTGDAERIAQEALDHSTRVMTRHYTQIVGDQLRNAMDEVDL